MTKFTTKYFLQFFYTQMEPLLVCTETNEAAFPVLVLENENSIESTVCKDKFSTKKCKKLEKKGKCKDKKISKMCKETCKKCTPGIIEKI